MARNGRSSAASENGREADRRRTILRAAIEVFAKKGYHGCRIADVAREAGVAYGLVYHYFENKEQLLQSVFDSAWTGFVQRVSDLATAERSLSEKVCAITQVAFEAYRHDPRTVKVLILEIARSPAGGRAQRQTAFVEVIRMMEAMFADAKRRGELREGVDPKLCAALLFGTIEIGLTAFVVALMDGRDEGAIARARDQISESFLRGVLPLPGEIPWKSEKSATRSRAPRRS